MLIELGKRKEAQSKFWAEEKVCVQCTRNLGLFPELELCPFSASPCTLGAISGKGKKSKCCNGFVLCEVSH